MAPRTAALWLIRPSMAKAGAPRGWTAQGAVELAHTPVAGARCVLAAEAQLLEQSLVARLLGALQVVQKRAAVVDHLDQTATGVVVLGVLLEMLGEALDALRENRDLHVRGARVLLVELELLADGILVNLTHGLP